MSPWLPQLSPFSLTQSRLLTHEVNDWMQKESGRVESRISKGIKKTQILLTVWWTIARSQTINHWGFPTTDAPNWPTDTHSTLCLAYTPFCKPTLRVHSQ